MSQRKRKALRKLREKLEAQEKQLQIQIENLKGGNTSGGEGNTSNTEDTQDKSETQTETVEEQVEVRRPAFQDDFAMLGIDVDDSAAHHFS